MILSSNGEELTGLWFDRQKDTTSSLEIHGKEMPDLHVFHETYRWLDLYFSAKDPGFTPPIQMLGSAFRRRVWEVLLTIPYGNTMTYGEIAKIIAREQESNVMSAQAVGGAVGHNNIALIIPCHRVVGSNGKLTGYAAGLERKSWLLKMERGLNTMGTIDEEDKSEW